MKILILGGSNSRNSGGVFDAARMMGLNLHNQNNVDVEYLMFDDEYSSEDRKYYSPLPVHSYSVTGPKKLGFSTNLYRQMKNISPDIVHTQSLWMYLSHVNKKYHNKTGTPYVISPHGMLDKWQLKQSFWKDLKKNIVLSLYEKEHLEKTTCFHALCQEEHNAIRDLGLKNPIAIIPNGVELPVEHNREVKTPNNPNGRKQLLFLGRLHQKKGLDNLLRAWSFLNPQQHNWQLVIAGETKDENYMQVLLNAAKELSIHNTVSFVGGQFGAAKHNCLRNSDAFILPSFSEGLPLSVLEAWSYRLPVLMTPFCNLPIGFEHNAAIETDTDADSIYEGLRKLIAMPSDERAAMGERGYNLVKQKFSWPGVTTSMTQLYQWILGKTAKPDFVYT